MTPRVDVLIVLHNSSRWLPSLFKGLRTVSVPLAVHFLDNNSSDGTPGQVLQLQNSLKCPVYLNQSLRNNGFARGVNLLASTATSDYLFLLNPDTELQPGCLENLVSLAESDSSIAICEARQIPRSHPKNVAEDTHETSWCSCAAALIRRKAFDQAGGFDERLYFMYCEDVDLSWKLWIKGWRCVFVPEAAVEHWTQDLDCKKRRTAENYFTFRNSIFLFYRFGSWKARKVFLNFLLKRFGSSAYSLRSKVLFGIAFIDHIRYIPYLLKTRRDWSGCKHSWIRFEETSLSH